MNSDIRLNSIGALPGRVKRASVINAAAATTWNLRDAASTAIVSTGALSAAVPDADTGQSIKTADFSAWTTAGTYYLEVPGLGQSPSFRIAPDAFNNSYILQMKGFYGWRCGSGVNLTSGAQVYSHGACHLNDGYLDNLGQPGVFKGSAKGWHDAGDYNKYIVNAGITMGCLLQAWERFGAVMNTIPLSHIPETGLALPDYLAELKWEMDWVLTMQYGPADGRVGHKLSATGFDAFEMPEQETATRYFVPYGTASTADFVAIAAKAARAFQPYDAAYAAKCSAAARVSWNYLVANPADVQANQTGFSTGGYTTTDTPHRLWAAAEMWETTGDPVILSDLEARITAEGTKCDSDFDWSNPKNLGIFTYALSARAGRNAALVTTVKNAIKAAADARVAGRNANGYGRTLNGNYYWGSNGSVARAALVLDVANVFFPNAAYLDTAMDQLGYLYGRNYYNRSQVTGEGINPPLNPHHRPSGADGIVNPWPGYLVGGGWPGATSWSDTQASYQTNEVAVNWNAAMAYNLAMFTAPQSATAPTPAPTVPACGVNSIVYRVNCGGGLYVPASGPNWLADQAWTPHGWGWLGGTAASTAAAIALTADDPLFQSERYDRGQEYRFAVQDGNYLVRLLFAENAMTGPGQRVFDVSINGALVINNLDIYASAGGQNKAWEQTFPVAVNGGDIDIVGWASIDNAKFSAIEISYVGPSCGTPTATPTATATATPTASPTATRTATYSPSPSGTGTATPSATRSATPSATQTPSPTRSPTATHSPTLSWTSSATPTLSFTATPTPSLTGSPTPTISFTPSITETFTPPPPGSTDTFTPTSSPTSSDSPTGTPSKSPSPTVTGTPSDSPSSTASPTLTATPSSTGTLTVTPSPTLTVSEAPSLTLTPVLSATPTQSPGQNPTANTPKNAPKILQSLAWTQAQASHFINISFQMEGDAEAAELKVYSKAMACVGTLKAAGKYSPGWNTAPFDSSSLGNGIYYYQFKVSGPQGSCLDRRAGKLFILR